MSLFALRDTFTANACGRRLTKHDDAAYLHMIRRSSGLLLFYFFSFDFSTLFFFLFFSPMKFMIIFMFIFARLIDGKRSRLPLTPYTNLCTHWANKSVQSSLVLILCAENRLYFMDHIFSSKSPHMLSMCVFVYIAQYVCCFSFHISSALIFFVPF